MVAETVAKPEAVQAEWARRAFDAVSEAQLMSESIAHIVEKLIVDCADKSFPLLEAILACTMRIDAAVDPVVEQGRPEVAHG